METVKMEDILSDGEPEQEEDHKMLFGVRVKDLLNPKKWISFLKGKRAKKHSWKHEVFVYRMIMAQRCINGCEGKCDGRGPLGELKTEKPCGCDALAKCLVLKEHCEYGCYLAFPTRKSWEDYKELSGLDFGLFFKNSLYKKTENGVKC